MHQNRIETLEVAGEIRLKAEVLRESPKLTKTIGQ